MASNRRDIFVPAGQAIVRAFEDAGKEVPQEIIENMSRRGVARA